MDLLPTDEQAEILSSVRQVLADRAPIGEPLSDRLWSSAAEQGWFGLGIAESDGGVGYGPVEETLLAIELGRVAAPGPFLAGIVGVHYAAAVGDTQLAGSLLSGESRLAWAEPSPESGLWILHHDVADRALLVDVVGQRVGLVSTAGCEPTRSIDELVPAARLGAVPDLQQPLSGEAADAVIATAMLWVAAYQAGIAEATCAQSVEYVSERVQFGQPVGAFQAVKHRCADQGVRAAAAAGQAHVAAIKLRDGSADSNLHIAAAALVAQDAAIANAQVNVQNHGGIGFTWEHTAHRFVTRARVLAMLLGGRRAAVGSLIRD
jgi:alkylation response protein AidB-like acyl-CoA dehydrogenase